MTLKDIEPQQGRNLRSYSHIPMLTLLCALSVLPLNVFLPSLAHIARDFQTDYALVSLSLAGYAVVAATLELVMGPLSDRFGRKPIILMSLAVFIVGSVGCALASDIESFLAFRLLQAAITCCYPVSMATIKDTSGKGQTASRIGYVAMVWALAPMLGPVAGGMIDEAFGWRVIFWCLAFLGVAMFVWCSLGFGETNQTRSSSIRQQFLSYSALLQAKRFWAYALCMAFSVGAFYAFLAGAPLLAAGHPDLSSASLGLFIGSVTAGYVFGSFLSGRFAGRIPLTTMMIAGRVTAFVGPLISLMFVLAGVQSVLALLAPCILIGIGNGLTMPSAGASAMSVRPELAGSAAGLAGAITIGGGAMMSSLTGAIITEENAAYVLFAMMLISAGLALLAAISASGIEKRITVMAN